MATRAQQPALLTPGVLAIASGLSVVAGILVIAYPDTTLLLLAIVAGINLLLLGTIRIVDALVADQDSGGRLLGVVVGVLSVVAGLIVVRRPGESLLAIIVILGIWFVIDGLLDALRVLMGDPDRGPLLLSAVIDLVLGILILSLPKLSLATLAILVGIGFVVRGLAGLFVAWRRRHEHPQRGPEPATS